MAEDLEASLQQLHSVIHNCPLIDNHAHNILLPSRLEAEPFESITTEAQGIALRDAFKSLPHLRAEAQLRELYATDPNANWDAILRKRREWLQDRPDQLVQKCLEGTHCILMDDGLGGVNTNCHPYHWHDRFTAAPTKRIVRIETVAEHIMEALVQDATEADLHEEDYFADTWMTFTARFESQILDAIQDFNVAGFKSVVCYRTGLDVEQDYNEALLRVGTPFEHYVAKCIKKRRFRVSRKALNDYLVLKTLETLSDSTPTNGVSKPIQFHTGLGDADINLLRSNPAYLQPIIESYPNVPFVVLHSAYPYTREAGYLATVYANVFLDVGEVFPMLSRDGELSVMRQALEVTPYNKLLWSTDGHWFPETYWLANKQFKETLEALLTEYVRKGDLSVPRAIQLVEDILFNNSNILYELHYPSPSQSRSLQPAQELSLRQPSASSSLYPEETLASEHSNHPATWERFLQKNASVNFVYVQWLDLMGTMRTRIVPTVEFTNIVKSNGRLGIARGNMGTLQDDTVTPAANVTGQIFVEPDLRTLRPVHRKDPLDSATVMGFWRDEDDKPMNECPRGSLERLVNTLHVDHDIDLLVGFEIEITFLKRYDSWSDEPYRPMTTTHAWGTFSPEQWLRLPILAEIVHGMADVGINVQQFHSESGQGQYEFILPPLPPLAAIDALVQARQVCHQIAALHDLRATLHPQPFPGIGTAAHAHMSLSQPEKEADFFVGGVMKHLSGICAFSMPESVSYGRVVDDHWTGGTWVAWGTQNRETPLRRIKQGRWEVRCLDGMANMYLAIASIAAAGLLGLTEGAGEGNGLKDCPYNPSQLSEEQRVEYGIERKLPATIYEALTALEADADLQEALPAGLTENFLAMKKVEQKKLEDMGEKERKIWLIERY